MTYQTIQEYNVTGLDGLWTYIGTTVPIFQPALLIGIYIITVALINLGTRKFQGQADTAVAMASAGFFTTVIGIIMSLTNGAINPYTIIVTMVIAIVSFIFLMTKKQRE